MKLLIAVAFVPLSMFAAPPALADPCNNQACLANPFTQSGGPFVGEWGAHKEHVVVNADGAGTETSNYGTMTFKMGSVSNEDTNQAQGNIVSGGRAEPGSWVTMQLVDGGRGMLFGAANGDQQFPFCKIVNGNRLNPDDCGA